MTDTERKEVELKTCPFCGNQPSISEAGHWAEVVISCNCHAVPQVVQRCVSVPNEDGKTFHYDHERAKREAIDIWNDRPQDRCKTGVEKVSVTSISPQDNNPEEGETKNDIAWQQGYAAGVKANNALVPLNEKEVYKSLNTVPVPYADTQTGRISLTYYLERLSHQVCAKFGKDNSGMVPQGIDIPRLKRVIDYQLDARGGQVNPKDDFAGFINDIMACIKFSQQPPKERKVSRESKLKEFGSL